MDIVVIGVAVSQPVDQPRISVEGEYDRLVLGENRVKSLGAQAMRMFELIILITKSASVRSIPHKQESVIKRIIIKRY